MFGRRKRRAFDMQFHPIVVSIFLKTHGDTVQPIAGKKDLISMYPSALGSGFVNILVCFNKLANNFLTAR